MTPEVKQAKTALIMGYDEGSLNIIQAKLRKCQIYDVGKTTDPSEAWSMIEAQLPDIILIEWKSTTDFNTIAFFNRLRKNPDTLFLPLLVLSPIFHKNDQRLLEEFPVTRMARLDLQPVLLKSEVFKLLGESHWYQANATQLNHLIERSGDQPETLVNPLLKSIATLNRPAPLYFMMARHLIKQRKYDEARRLLEVLIQKDANNFLARNELGKIHLITRNYREAIKVLEPAHNYSPLNINNTLNLGEAHLNMQNFDRARQLFEEVEALDPTETKAHSGIIIAKNLQEYLANSRDEELGIDKSLSSLCNSAAISLVRSKSYDRGVEQYQSALSFSKSRINSARIAFNLGLCFMRWKKYSEALPWFHKSSQFGKGQFEKSDYYIRLIENKLGPLTLKPSTQKPLGNDVFLGDESDLTTILDEEDDLEDSLNFDALAADENFSLDDEIGESNTSPSPQKPII